MNIAINTLPLVTEHRMRGTGVYTKNLIDALQKYEKNHSYSFFTRVQDIPRNADMVHYPFFDPFFLTLPFFKQYPTVVTVHDLIPIVFSDAFPPGVKGRIKWHIQRLSLMGVKRIITDSECSKRDIGRLIGKDASWVDVVPLAPSPMYQRILNREQLGVVKKRYHLPDEYVLYVGDVNWNKNVMGLIDIWKIVKAKLAKSSDVKLVLVGSAFADTEIKETRDLVHLMDSSHIGKSILRPGFIKDEDMASVYSAASCVVLPSWYEGFGLPVLEAMACGVPVVATNRGSVSEISGPAIIEDPQATEAFAKGIIHLVAMPQGKRNEIINKGFAWVRAFTWQRVAHETVKTYERVIPHM